ncbi:MAG: patatin-like phospholipase family protein [Flavobacteriaceae bacterium]
MTTGLVLSGGGFRGIAHIGVIKAMEEAGIQATHVAGTSSGAIIGALYAAGYTHQEILEFVKGVNLFSIYKYAVNKPGFVDTEKFYKDFKRLFPEDNFGTLKLPMFITATDVLKGALKVFSSGPIIRPILASAAFPGVFTPVKIDSNYYIDGGTLNNFPVDLLRAECENIIGVYVNPFLKIQIEDMKHSYQVLERAYQIRAASTSTDKFEDCDLLITPEGLRKFGTFSLKDTEVVFELGYQSAKQKMGQFLERISK